MLPSLEDRAAPCLWYPPMQLRGWANPLPMWLADFVRSGFITIVEIKGNEYLQGVVINPEGTRVEFK